MVLFNSMHVTAASPTEPWSLWSLFSL